MIRRAILALAFASPLALVACGPGPITGTPCATFDAEAFTAATAGASAGSETSSGGLAVRRFGSGSINESFASGRYEITADQDQILEVTSGGDVSYFRAPAGTTRVGLADGALVCATAD